MLFFFCLGERKYWKMKLINDLCSTGFWVSVLLPTFFRFHFGSDVKEFDKNFLISFESFGRRLGVGHSREEMSLRNPSRVWQANRADGVTAAMSDDWSQEVNGGDPDCRARAKGRKRKWNSGRRLAPPEEEALFPCLPARLFRHCSILVPGLRTLPFLNPEPTPLVHHVKTPLRAPPTLPPLPIPPLSSPPPGCCLAGGINIHWNCCLLLSRPSYRWKLWF